ncbi:MAG: nucleotidyltransferase domain-containing protein [Candidatus Woesearchaeota archaeon]
MENQSEKEEEFSPEEMKLPPEAREKLRQIKDLLEKLKDNLLKKFDKYLIGVALLPPQKPEKPEDPVDLNKINVLVLIDDSDSQNLNRQELKDKIDSVVLKMAQEIDKNLVPQVVILTELWQSCFDAKYEILQMIAISAPVYDKGLLAAIKIAEIHKSMVLKKFERYIVSYVLSGSLVRGEATETSDIDVMIIIDDTDVKKMTRAELKDKLRAIIIGMGIEAGEITGIRNKLNIQVYILTDFWDSLREANPIIFTLLRDGVPFYDRGLFTPWKQMLKLGKIKPSQEAIELFMSSGEQMLKRVQFKLNEMGMEDIYYAILTPSQAALMLYGVAPPAPRETAKLMREIFVKKEKLLEENYVDILEKNIQIRKEIEHGTKKELSGSEIDDLLKNADMFLKRINNLFKEIESVKEKESVLHLYDSCLTVIRDVLRVEGVEKASDNMLLDIFEKEIIHRGLVPEKYHRIVHNIIKANEDYEAGKLTKADIEKIKKESNELIKFMIEYVQRKRGKELERARIRVKHGERFGEIILLDNIAYIIHDLDNEDKDITKARITEEGGLADIVESSPEELENSIANAKIPPKTFIKQKIFEDLKNIFGKDVEILINY